MIGDLEKRFCEYYELKPGIIKGDKLLSILELLTIYLGKIELHDMERHNCNYSFYLLADKHEERTENDWPLCGTGWGIKDCILNLCLDSELYNNDNFKEDLQYLLFTPMEKIKQFLTI